MANNDSVTPITTGSVTAEPKKNGIYYFKLDSRYFLYDGDEQRICGLSGAEIDSDLHFLSGMDIKDIQLNPEEGTVVITRVNEEDFSAITLSLTEVRPELRFDKEEGVLYMIYPDGEEKVAEGFFVDFNDEGKYEIKVYTDGTLDGLGTMYSPLSLSKLERTGTFAPVETLIKDPENEEYSGRRVLTKELIDDYGHLYTYPELVAIQAALEAENSPWRVATKADWDEMLNAMENEEDRTHDETRPGYKGFAAGGVLKSSKYWDLGPNANFNDEGRVSVGFNVLPVGYAPAGRGPVINADDFDIEEFGQSAGFWTRNEGDEEEAYVKIFGAGFDSVRQYREETEDYSGTLYSIRLVREYTPECAEQYETILGSCYPVGPIVGICADYGKVWTLCNFYGTGNGYTGIPIRGENVPELTDYAYFINECDGKKKRMKEGESIVILDRPGLHEHRIINGELVDVFDEVNTTISELSANTMSLIDDVMSSTAELSASTITAIENETTRAISANEELSSRLNELSGYTAVETAVLSGSILTNAENIEELGRSLSELSNDVYEADDLLDDRMGNVESDITSIEDNVSALSSSTVGVSNLLNETINNVERLEDNVFASISATSNEIIAEAKDYTDEKVNEINAVKVNDIYYDDRLKYLRLVKADGSLSDGIPADEFLKDSVLTSVEYDEGNSRLIFVWNDDYTTRTYIPLEKLSNIYGISQDSLAYLKMSGTNISAIVDKGDGFEKTLATTKYVDDKTFELEETTTANTAAIEVLNGDKNVAGSVKHTIEDRFVSDIIAGGPVVTTTTLDDARNNSLMRVISVDGERKYFVSSDAADMQAKNNSGTPVILNSYINSLETRVGELEAENTELKDRVNELEREVAAIAAAGIDEATVKNIIRNYLSGVDKEIKLNESGGTLQIGFADDAVFGWTM